jgi:hypothetical protein
MMDQWTDRLSEYLDGDLPVGERRELEVHLADCAACRSILDQLRAVVVRAGALDDRAPTHDLWPDIARAIGAGGGAPGRVLDLDAARRARAPRKLLVGWTNLAAAAAALVAVSAGAGWFVAGMRGPQPVAVLGEPVPSLVSPAASVVRPSYDHAVRELTDLLQEGRGRLDTTTVRVLEHSLSRIDAAIAEARRALAADPASAYLNSHLAETMRRKLELLRRAAALVSVES